MIRCRTKEFLEFIENASNFSTFFQSFGKIFLFYRDHIFITIGNFLYLTKKLPTRRIVILAFFIKLTIFEVVFCNKYAFFGYISFAWIRSVSGINLQAYSMHEFHTDHVGKKNNLWYDWNWTNAFNSLFFSYCFYIWCIYLCLLRCFPTLPHLNVQTLTLLQSSISSF